MTARDLDRGPWTLVIPAPAPWINANQRLNRYRLADHVRAWRHAASWRARKEGIPTGLARVHILAKLHMVDQRRRDPHNYYPTCKAVVDGLVDHGLIADDDSTRLDGPDLRLGHVVSPSPSRPWGCLALTITALEADRG